MGVKWNKVGLVLAGCILGSMLLISMLAGSSHRTTTPTPLLHKDPGQVAEPPPLWDQGSEMLADAGDTLLRYKNAAAMALSLSDQESSDAKRALDDVNGELLKRREDLSGVEGEIADARKRRSRAEDELALARESLSKLRKQVAQLEVSNSKLQRKEKRAAEKVAVAEEQENVATEKELEAASLKKFMFNEYVSSKLPLDRAIPDTRIDECKHVKYDVAKLPSHSVIICFVDEAWSALLRTVWSVINRTPHSLIHEILLVDDGSDASWLGGTNVPKLRDYIVDSLPTNIKVSVHSTGKRMGLIRARLFGAKRSTGKIITFLDSHCECNLNWAEPILEIIGKDRTAVVTPVIDTIDFKTMDHASWTQRVPAVGTFAWTMDFTWKGGKVTPGNKITDPVDSPTMAGGLFSIEKKYFYELGSYDPQMDGWGGENIEMSFRIWQCGGTLVTAPCSHVGHIFRDSHPYSVPGASIHDTFTRNSIRAAEVWMDGYKEYYYKTRPANRKVDFGDISSRLALRKKLQCKSFKWYMKTLLPDMFIPDKEHIKVQGALHNTDGQCLDKMGERAGGKAGVYWCHGQGSNQAWMHTSVGEIRADDDLCLDAWANTMPGDVFIQKCHGAQGNQKWTFDKDAGTFKSDSGNCLESFAGDGGTKVLKINTCNGAETQKWKWDTEEAVAV